MRLLEIGPATARDGTVIPIDSNWETLSVGGGATFNARWGWEPLPIQDNTFDLVHAAHVLEHIEFWKAVGALKEVLRILKPGGWLEVHVPNVEWLIQRWKSRQMDGWNGHGLATDETGRMIPGLWFNARAMGFSESPNWDGIREHYKHRTLYDKEFLGWVLTKAGFVDVQYGGVPRGTEKHGALPHDGLALNLSRKARKP